MKEPLFLSLDQVIEIHQIQLREYGGQDGVRDQGALESAMAQPESGFGEQFLHAYPFGMAAAYAFHIAENQPFIDGNKRTALNAALAFLELNGIALDCPGAQLFQAMIDVGNRHMPKEGLEQVFKSLVSPK